MMKLVFPTPKAMRLGLWMSWLLAWSMSPIAIVCVSYQLIHELTTGSWWWLAWITLLFVNLRNLSTLMRIGPPWSIGTVTVTIRYYAICNRLIGGIPCGKYHYADTPEQAAINAEQCDHISFPTMRINL